jgi:hypothetical protein
MQIFDLDVVQMRTVSSIGTTASKHLKLGERVEDLVRSLYVKKSKKKQDLEEIIEFVENRKKGARWSNISATTGWNRLKMKI